MLLGLLTKYGMGTYGSFHVLKHTRIGNTYIYWI